jgi:hypothetical protein
VFPILSAEPWEDTADFHVYLPMVWEDTADFHIYLPMVWDVGIGIGIILILALAMSSASPFWASARWGCRRPFTVIGSNLDKNQ